ncbi:MAG TPA: TonB-dependent receptor, partial [Polyangia bacterium]
MNRIRVGATALGLALLATASVAQAQEVTGRVTGRVTDKDTGTPMGGVTVIMQGPQGEDATLTDDKGEYRFSSLPVGSYVIRFYAANTSTEAEQPGVTVAADKMVRVNAKIAGAAQTAAQQTYVITGKAPMIDIGSARVGAQFEEPFMQNVPLGRTYGDVIERAPGAFFDPSGNVSIGGATGLENIYLVNGMNVTGVQYGNLEAGVPTVGGGTNLPIEFLTQLDVNSGGYQAEFGGAMGGVINSVLKSGSNEFHGSAFLYDSPYWLAANPNPVIILGKSLGYERKPDFDTSIGVEVGGPIIKDKLFFWAGFAPRITDTHVLRLTYALQDANGDGVADTGANGRPIMNQLSNWTARIPESHKTYYYAGTLDFVPRPEHHLTVTLMGSPNFNNEMGNRANGVSFASDPKWAQEDLTKVNTDVNAHWTSKLFDHHWQIDAITGYHSEYLYDRSPYSDLNNQNQLEYWGANLSDLEHAPGCQPTASGFEPCPVDNYHTGGFGLEKKYTAGRYTAEIKLSNLFEAGGHHEVKYGWHLESATLDEDTWYSGPLGGRGLVQLYPGASVDPNSGTSNVFNTFTFATLPPGAFPSSYGPMPGAGSQPVSNLLSNVGGYGYQDSLHAAVRSLSNAFFLQDSYSPPGLRNLTINAGVRYELQKMYDFQDTSFLSLQNLGPRVGAVYDPFNDGKSKISVGYGRYFEAIPLDIAARYFGGQGIVVNSGVPFTDCNQQNPYAWAGNGEWRNCNIPPYVTPGTTPANYANNATGGTSLSNNGVNYPVQANLQGQYSNEIVASAERQIADDTTVRVDYQHRWIGAVIEDGTADPSFTFVLANPGHVPESAITQAKANLYDAQQAANARPADPQIQANLNNAQAVLTTLQGLASAPSPERTYDAITLSLNKRFAKNWYTRASYTYSRLIGNYEGLYQVEQNYFAPNGSNYTDTPDLYLNQNGPLPNDHPHILHLDGYYSRPVGAKGRLTLGLSFSARSGMPRNYISDLYSGQQINMLLPRGSAGR